MTLDKFQVRRAIDAVKKLPFVSKVKISPKYNQKYLTVLAIGLKIKYRNKLLVVNLEVGWTWLSDATISTRRAFGPFLIVNNLVTLNGFQFRQS